jgi:hypothetical protein
MSDPKNAIDLGHVQVLTEASHEIARLWVTHKGPSTVFINAHSMPDPVMFGMLLADAAHHGAKAYAQAHGITEEEAHDRIWQGLELERESSGELETIDPTGVKH